MADEKEQKIKRYEWLDIIKGICIFAVVLFHIQYQSKISFINNIWEYADKISGLYKVTIFYCVAGITLNNEKLKKTFSFLWHKFKKLYLKAISIGLLAVVAHNFLIKIGFYKIGYISADRTMKYYTSSDYIKNSILTFLLGNREVILGAFWFVYTLIICFIFLAIIDAIINKIKVIKNKRVARLIITFILMLISIFLSNYLDVTIPRINNSLVGLFLLDFTNFLFENGKFEKTSIPILISSILLLAIGPFFGSIIMNTNKITSPYFLLVVVFSALYILVCFSKKYENKLGSTVIKIIGRNSFSIMAFHFIGFKIGGLLLILIGQKIDVSILVPSSQNALILIYYIFFGIGIPIIINLILKKIFKFQI